MRSFLFKRGFILPVTVTGVIPLAITLATAGWRSATTVSLTLGTILYVVGISLLLLTTGLFAEHHGSLAPWNPPTELVLVGPYRYCRNPMITGVLAMVTGEAIALQSPWIAGWLALFATGMTIHILRDEEPALKERFGEPYVRYCQNVPRWIPRLTPYEPTRS